MGKIFIILGLSFGVALQALAGYPRSAAQCETDVQASLAHDDAHISYIYNASDAVKIFGDDGLIGPPANVQQAIRDGKIPSLRIVTYNYDRCEDFVRSQRKEACLAPGDCSLKFSAERLKVVEKGTYGSHVKITPKLRAIHSETIDAGMRQETFVRVADIAERLYGKHSFSDVDALIKDLLSEESKQEALDKKVRQNADREEDEYEYKLSTPVMDRSVLAL